MVGASLFVTYSAIHLLSMAYAVTNQVIVLGATLDLDNSDPAGLTLNFTIVVENPTTIDLHLAYIKITADVFELAGDGDLRLSRDLFVHVYDPDVPLNAASDTALSFEIANVEDLLSINPPKRWVMSIYLHVPDAPLLGNRAVLKRYASIETSF